MVHVSPTNTPNFDELVFVHRNQAYGAYVLRREYPRQVLKSLLIGIAMMAGLLAIPYLMHTDTKKHSVKPNMMPYITCDMIVPVSPPIEDLEDAKDPCGSRGVFTVPMVDPCNEPLFPIYIEPEPVKPVVENSFNPDGFIEIEEEEIDFQLGKKSLIYDPYTVHDPPSFPGGEEAMLKFLADNLVYPEHAHNIGLEGKVYVTFVVDQFGNLTHIETPRPLGGGLDEEAIRVMKIMPRWKPGRQNGHPVQVRYQLPIIFQLD
jgi:protein TonB